MSQNQINSDIAESRPWYTRPEFDELPKHLRKTTGKERRHRDRGNAQSTPGWKESLGRQRD